MKKSGFTLMEVLVTLGIIGIVSALTIPSLIQNWQREAYVAQLHKVYNTFSQAFEREMAEKRASSLYETGLLDIDDEGEYIGLKNFLHENFKVVKDCGDDNYTECFASEYKSLSGTTRNSDIFGYIVSIADGTSIALETWGSSETEYSVGTIIVDTNGTQGPNIAGRDFFRMYIYGDGTIDDYNIDKECLKDADCARERRQSNFEEYCMNPNDTDGCFGRILNDNWTMKY